MKIKTVRVRNYKSIEDSTELELGENFTVIVGQNNSGKTAFIERLSFAGLKDNAHHHGKVDELFVANPVSTNDVVLHFSGAELDLLIRKTGRAALLNLPEPFSGGADKARAYYASQFLPAMHTAPLIFTAGTWVNPSRAGAAVPAGEFRSTADRTAVELVGISSAPINSVSEFLAAVAASFSYVFRAERLNISQSSLQADLSLKPDATNLAGALLQLQGRHRDLFAKLNAHLSSIIPSVEEVTVATQAGGGSVEVRVWNKGMSISHPLADCGTGIGQVLAILFVILTSEFGHIIVIDEPNSFLHPSASRALMLTLKEYPQHQYIVATHATEIVSAVDPDIMLVVRWENGQSKFATFRREDEAATRHALDEVGARLSDVFGHDAIVWVEGKTEAICFPKLAVSGGVPVAANRIGYVPIINTGDLLGKRRNPELAWQLYDTLSKQSALMPRALAFSLDRENWNQKDMDDLRRRSKDGRVVFLPRRTYENYLLHPEAISAVLQKVGDAEAVRIWLQENGGQQEYLQASSWNANLADPMWLQNVDGAKLLADLVAGRTANKEQYIKTTHSPAITDWLLENKPDHLGELRAYVLALHTKG
jgi:predicted ATPase